MSKRKWIYNSALLAGLIFVALGVRLYFRDDISGVIIHFALAAVLFIAALLTGRAEKNDEDGDGS
jgi:hypothetical protein